MTSLNEIFLMPQNFINSIEVLPDFLKLALCKAIILIPVVYIMAAVIEIFEQYILNNMTKLTWLYKKMGVVFGALFSAIPECGMTNITSILYSRRLASPGTVIAALIVCCDDALPILFIEPSKILYIIPILIIKLIIAIAAGFVIDIAGFFTIQGRLDRDQTLQLQIREPGCCSHYMDTEDRGKNWSVHAFSHTLNIFVFSLIILTILYALILHFGDVTTTIKELHLDTVLTVFVVAAIGLISNCVSSILIALLYVTGLISFGPFMAGLITVNGLALSKINKYAGERQGKMFSLLLYVIAIVVGTYIFLF